ncbi:MAG: DNA polymerase III subunit epsilon [Rudaea sp.]|nr:DNA polymerase III subunit epsilon [Rudaea sp.]
MRQIVLDTETTGLEVGKGHRLIEIGAIELAERRATGRSFHRYVNPQRAIDEGALAVHGISNEFLADKPVFAEIARELIEFVDGAELVIHNAAFDVAFLDAELAMADAVFGRITDHARVLDTLALAREKYPGQKNNLDALCRRLNVDNSHRDLHGALLDAQLLAEVYLAMTGGQGDLGFASERAVVSHSAVVIHGVRPSLLVRLADAAELALHEARLGRLDAASKGRCLWQNE